MVHQSTTAMKNGCLFYWLGAINLFLYMAQLDLIMNEELSLLTTAKISCPFKNRFRFILV